VDLCIADDDEPSHVSWHLSGIKDFIILIDPHAEKNSAPSEG